MTRDIAPRAVVFDIGNVLVQWRPEAHYDARFGRARREAFFANVPIAAANLRSDLGSSLEREVRDLAAVHAEWSAEVMAWWDDWPEIFSPVVAGSAAILQELKSRGVPVFALSNFGAETFEIACAIYPFLTLFDAAFVSGRLRLAKPDPAFYAALEESTGFSGSEIVFADDLAENIAPAAARGWRTHLFVNAAGWRACLEAEGVL